MGLEVRDQGLAALGDRKRGGDAADIVPDFGEGIRLEGDDLGAALQAAGHRGLDVAQAHGTDFALDLGEDVGGLEALDDVIEDVVDRDGLARGLFDEAIDFGAAGIDGDAGAGADGERVDGLGVVALVRAADQVGELAKGVDDFGGAGDQRDDTGHRRSV